LVSKSNFNDSDPFFYHCIKDPYHGEEIVSKEMYDLFEPILKRFCNKYKYTYNYLIRASINLTISLKNKIGGIHKDHDFKYQSIIIYLIIVKMDILIFIIMIKK
jgi:hypothetical protein